MSNTVLSFIVLAFVVSVVAATFGKPPRAVQPAMVVARIGRVPRRPVSGLDPIHHLTPVDDDTDQQGPTMIDVLRVFGLARREVPRAVVGPKAYVRWWERARAGIVLTGIVVMLGFALAAVIGVMVLGAGFLLEHAIS